MTASNPADAGTPPDKRIVFWRVLRERLKVLSPTRWAFLALGIASLGYGQYLIEQRYPHGAPLPQAELWNAVYRLQIVNFDNVLRALPYFIGGVILCALTALPTEWKISIKGRELIAFGREKLDWKRQIPYIFLGGVLFVFLIVQLAKHKYIAVYPFLWIVSIIAFTHVMWKWDRNAKKNLSPGITFQDLLWIASLLILGFIINSVALQDIPASLVPDEGSFWEIARSIAIRELKPAFFDSGVYSFPIASSIYQGWILRIFGVNLWGWRFSSVIAGVATVIPLYLLGREWFNRRVAVTAAVIMVSNPYFIAFARLGYNNSQSLLPVVLCIYFFALAVRKESLFYLWLAGITAGISFYTYSAAWLGLVTLCPSMLYLLLLKQIKWREALIALGVILAAWGFMVAPRIAYTASGENAKGLTYKIFETSFVNSFYAKAFYGEADLVQTTPLIHFSENDTIFYDPAIYRELLLRGAVRTLVAIFDPYIVREHFLITGFAGFITPVFFLIGLALSLRLWEQWRFGIPVIWLVGGLIFLSMIAAFPPRHTHLVSVIPVLALLSGVGLSAAVESLAELPFLQREHVKPVVQGFLLSIASIAIIYFGCQRYFVAMFEIYPPLFEDIASWIAWKTPAPVHLIYVGENKPHSVEYLVDSKLVHHTYQPFTTGTFDPQTDIDGNIPTIIFIEEDNKILESKFRKIDGFSVPIPYFYKSEKLLGYVITNTVFDISPKIDWDEGVRSLIATPVKWIFIPLLVLMAVSGWNTFAKRQNRKSIGNKNPATP